VIKNKKNITEKTQDSFKSIVSKRGQNRKTLLKEVSLNFLDLCRTQEVLSFPREHLNRFVKCLDISTRQQQKTATEILNILKQDSLIKEDIVKTSVYSFRNKPLKSFDYGSFSKMMEKNGYKRVLYKWEISKYTNTPIKKKIGVLGMGEPIPEGLSYDDIQKVSYKPKNQQGVYTMGNKSIVKDFCYYQEKKVYSIVK